MLNTWLRADEDAVARAMAAAGVADLADRLVSELSGGQRQRAWIAMVLAQETPYLLMDEPTSALDPVKSREVSQLLRGLSQQGVTIICVTHDLSLAESLLQDVTFVHSGRIHAVGSVASLAQRVEDPVIQAFFGTGSEPS
jgi:iron complex transport system ATP-binding protein